jgi:ribosomal protein S18 acetylase RimI-like enzyme
VVVIHDELVIRSAREDDCGAAHRLMESLGYPNLDPSEFSEAFRAVLSRNDTAVLIAENRARRIVALASISWRPQLRLTGTLVSIDELVVEEAGRGRGAGRLMLDKARDIAHRLGARRIELETRRSRESYARGFYPKNGFVEADSAVMRADL